MVDISKCLGTGCPVRNQCYRFRAPTTPERQAYSTDVPYNSEADSCPSFWDCEGYRDLTPEEPIDV